MAIRKLQRKDRVKWEARWVDPNSRKLRGKTFDTKKEAEAFEADLKVSRNRGTYVDPSRGRQTLAQWWAKYLESPAWDDLRPGTRSRYASLMDLHVLPHLGGRHLAGLRRHDVSEWQTRKRAEGTSPATVNAAHRVLRLVLQRAVDAEVVATNPARGVKSLKTDREEMRFLSPPEVDAIVAAIDDRFKTLVSFLAWTGLRFGEAAALRLENLDLLRGRVQVVEAYSEVEGKLYLGDPKTAHSRRTVTLPRFVVQDLERHLQDFPPGKDGLVFSAPGGGPVRGNNFRSRFWAPALEEAGIRAPLPRVHDLRHTAVSFAIRAGAHPKEIQARAGHSSITVTMDRYGHLLEGMDTALAERLEEMRTGSWYKVGTPEMAEVVNLKQ